MDQTPKTVLAAFSNFKGTISNIRACEIANSTLSGLGYKALALPIADGGKGTLETILHARGGELLSTEVSDPLGSARSVSYLCFPTAADPKTIVLESALCCGFDLMERSPRNAMRASSRGLGELLLHISEKHGQNVEEVLIGLGDSAVSDAGTGMLQALGFQLTDTAGKKLWPSGENLRALKSIRPPQENPLRGIRIKALCDVVNPLCGADGSARIFSPQKGAGESEVGILETGMKQFSKICELDTGKNVASIPMTGAAGGISAALHAYLDASLVQGANFLLNWIEFPVHVAKCDLLLTGEGRTDSQTLAGKAPAEALKIAQEKAKPAVLLSGELTEGQRRLSSTFQLISAVASGKTPSPEEALSHAIQATFQDSDFLAKWSRWAPL